MPVLHLLLAAAAWAQDPAVPADTDVPAPAPDPAPDPVLVPPELLGCPELPYPAGLDVGAQRVEAAVLVDEQGRVEAVTASAGDEPFRSAVLEALIACTFTPATEDGAPIAVEIPFGWDFPRPPVNVAGIVRSAGARQPVEALVVVVGDRQASTDAEGRFELRNVTPGAYELRVLDPAWRLPSVTFEVSPEERVDLDLFAIATGDADEAVGVYRVTRQTASRRSLTREEVRSLPGTMGDPVRALQNAPGLVRTPFDAGWLLVRGGDPDDTAVFLDGVRVPLLFHLGGMTSILHPEMVGEVSLTPGAWPSRYGGALSGIVDLVPAEVVGDRRAIGGVNLVWSHAYLETPLAGGGLAVAARRSYLDAVLAAVLDPQRAQIAPRFWDAQARWDGERAGVMVLGMSDAIDTPTGNGSETVTVTQTAGQVQGRFEAEVAGGDLVLRPWLARQVRDLSTLNRAELETQTFPGARLEYRRSLEGEAGAWDLLVGAEAENRWYRVERDGAHREGQVRHADPYLHVGVGDEVRAEAGVRLETLFIDGQYPRAAWSPRGAVRWQVLEGLDLLAEGGQFHQAPPALLLLGFHEGAYLGLERSTFGSVGVRQEHESGLFSIGADLWTRKTEDLAGIEQDNTFGRFDGRAWGLETLTQLHVGQTDARAVVQASRSLRREEQGDAWVPYRYDQPLLAQLALIHSLPREWTLSGRWRYGTGWPFAQGADPEAFDILTQAIVPLVPNERERLEPYHALDLKVSKRFSWRAWQLDAYLDVQNAYARRVPEPAINGIDDTEVVYGYGLPFLPIFGIDATFWP